MLLLREMVGIQVQGKMGVLGWEGSSAPYIAGTNEENELFERI